MGKTIVAIYTIMQRETSPQILKKAQGARPAKKTAGKRTVPRWVRLWNERKETNAPLKAFAGKPQGKIVIERLEGCVLGQRSTKLVYDTE